MPKARVELNELDAKVMLAIRELRATEYACSFGSLMRHCGYQSKAGPQTRCATLKKMGCVDWSEGVSGSIHLTAAGESLLRRYVRDHAEEAAAED